MNRDADMPVLIEKELIPTLSFKPKVTDERSTETMKLFRKRLKQSQILGNIHHSKVKIIFEDSEGLKEVRTTIWSADDEFIVLKKGIFIPLNRVVRIVF